MNLDQMRHHLMAGVVERLARSPERDAFVLRGGLLTRAWVDPVPRPTRDLDFVGDFAFDRIATATRFARVLDVAVDDDVLIDRTSLTATSIWTESAFPGVRLELALGLGAIDQKLSVDVGFNDPLVPPAVHREVPGSTGPAVVRAVRPETQLAWKLHALAEMTTSWRPKDLHDVWLITSRVALDDAELSAAIRAAFESRGFTHAQAVGVFEAQHWATKTSRLRWERPAPLDQVVGEVSARLEALFANLPEWP